MSENDSKTLTTIPVSSFGGVFRTAYMNFSNQLPRHQLSNPPEIGRIWQTQELTGLRVQYQLTISSDLTGDDLRGQDRCTFERLQNHWLMDLVPDAGMSRVFECLKDIFEDYVDRPAYSGPFTRRLEAVPMSIGKTYERPALEYTED